MSSSLPLYSSTRVSTGFGRTSSHPSISLLVFMLQRFGSWACRSPSPFCYELRGHSPFPLTSEFYCWVHISLVVVALILTLGTWHFSLALTNNAHKICITGSPLASVMCPYASHFRSLLPKQAHL
ncbi:hypothetical protein HYDPIDRAFT_33591 [Hydnomerulius pinastri MD-312]|uniref:Uncharacterized protein n=1 Tax=Hydnomerulius pinastri MD-312 TaxID=994086 RepID=A0A0C9VZU2_9AGAM|nr:hypothetical protein HYDPIDRAFT_33591 [Hydnomerulius pinastri MD-312]